MKVEMKIKIAGSRNGVRWPEAGTVLDLPEGEAVDLISQGVAVPVAEVKPEKAAAKKPEKR
ncbi:hypothetical protein [Aeromicrobium sp.]|uniref:hypothetical protein n=1 Tax=Aeromicrobium sp. TaxID=1871063 RepID=UPI002FC882EA